MWNSVTTFEQPEPPKDIVDRLREADRQQRKTIEGAMIIGDVPAKSLLLEAAQEIEKLRRVLGMTEN